MILLYNSPGRLLAWTITVAGVIVHILVGCCLVLRGLHLERRYRERLVFRPPVGLLPEPRMEVLAAYSMDRAAYSGR